MKTVYIRKNESHFFKKGIALSLLIFVGLAAHANPSSHEAPPSLPLKGKVSSSASDCTYTLSPASNSVGADAGVDVTVTVTPTGTSCTAWTATVASNARWITITSGARGTGIGTVTYSYKANMATMPRTGTLTIANLTYTVTQAGRPLTADSYEGDAGNNTPATAHLFAADFSPRLQLDAVASIDISPATCHISSDVDIYKIILPTDYTYALTATLYNLSNPINHSNYTLDANISCSTNGVAWEDPSHATLTATVPGGTLYLKIGPSGSYWRAGTYAAKIEIKAGCRGILSATSNSVEAAAGVGELTVTTGSSCVWATASHTEWITITSEAGAIGSGNVRYSYTENTSLSPRIGAISIARETYAVTQAPAPDRLEENNTETRATPLTAAFTNNASVIDISSVNCHKADDVDYYKIELEAGYTYRLSGALYDSGNPNEDNLYTLDAKISYLINEAGWSEPVRKQLLPATVRGGTLYLKIEPFGSGRLGTYAEKIEIKRTGTAGCTYTLSPANKQAMPGEGADRVAVNSASTCFWATASDVEWITVVSGSGTGEGHAAYSYRANMAPTSRIGHLTIGDQTYTVTQEGRPLAADAYEGNEGNNTKDKTYPFPAPTFTQNVGTVNISEASCHLASDVVDYYKIELPTGYTYRLSGALHDATNQNEGSNYTLNAKISYSANNGTTWRGTADSQLGPATVSGGTLYLKIEPFDNGNTGTYAAKIEIKRVVAT